jgi:hypothetical protein
MPRQHRALQLAGGLQFFLDSEKLGARPFRRPLAFNNPSQLSAYLSHNLQQGLVGFCGIFGEELQDSGDFATYQDREGERAPNAKFDRQLCLRESRVFGYILDPSWVATRQDTTG